MLADENTKPPFKLARASFKRKGLQPHLKNADWQVVRGIIYNDPKTSER